MLPMLISTRCRQPHECDTIGSMETPTLGALVPFIFRDNLPIRTAMGEDGEAWFVLADLCAVLEIGQPRTVTRRMDDDMIGTAMVDTGAQGARTVTIVSEPGMYEIVLRSNRPEAKNLRRWVTHEVLPSIRKSGFYATAKVQRTIHNARMGLTVMHGAVARAVEMDVPPGKQRDHLMGVVAQMDGINARTLTTLVDLSDPNFDPDMDTDFPDALIEAISRR